MFTNKYIFALIILPTVLAGCTSKSLYQSGQNYEKNQCLKDAITAEQHNECLTAKPKPYEEYEQEREDIKGSK